MKHQNWTRDETIIAFNLYCKIPFKDCSARHPQIRAHAKILGRTAAALNMKIGNLGRLDPQLQKRGITGLAHGSKLEQEVWDAFHGNWEKLIGESEQLIAKFQTRARKKLAHIDAANPPAARESARTVKTRVNQNFFRQAVLSAYDEKCCITGVAIPALLIASHIIPWKENTRERLNPRNGLCLNALHDKAFDRGLLTVTPDYKILLSSKLRNAGADAQKFFTAYAGKRINAPEKFAPAKEFLRYHNEEVFEK